MEADASSSSHYTAKSLQTFAYIRKPEITSTVLSSKWVKCPIVLVLTLHATVIFGCTHWTPLLDFCIDGLVSGSSRAEKHLFESSPSGFRENGPATNASTIIWLGEVFQETVSLFVPFGCCCSCCCINTSVRLYKQLCSTPKPVHLQNTNPRAELSLF